MYRKFTADYIFSGQEILPANKVLITTEEGTIIETIDKEEAGDDIETYKGIITPGFINCHCHIELSHMQGVVPTKTGLVEFVQQVMKNRNAGEEAKITAMHAAEQELCNSGTVAVGDICNTTDSIELKQNSKLHWHNFIEVSGFVDAAAEKRFSDAKNILNEFNSKLGTQYSTLSPHAPYSVSKTLFQLLNEETKNQLITIHNQESAAEDELYKNKQGDFLSLYKNFGIDISGFEPTGKSSLQSWLPYFTNNQNILLVHNTFIGKEDIDFINSQHYYCLCPNANKYIEQRMPPINLLRNNNCNIVIGTDSYASNWQLNMLEEIKTIQQETAFTIPLEEILRWATINGAKALQLEKEIGNFDKGKKPGIVLIDAIDDLKITKESSARRIV